MWKMFNIMLMMILLQGCWTHKSVYLEAYEGANADVSVGLLSGTMDIKIIGPFKLCTVPNEGELESHVICSDVPRIQEFAPPAQSFQPQPEIKQFLFQWKKDGIHSQQKFLHKVQARTGDAKEVTCPVSGDANSIEVWGANASRLSFVLNNISADAVRIAFVSTGTPKLVTTNSFILRAGSSFADSFPGVYLGKIVCQSTSAGTPSIISISETRR